VRDIILNNGEIFNVGDSMRNTLQSFTVLLLLLILINPFFDAFSQSDTGNRIGQMSRPFAEIVDPELIEFLIDQYLIPEDEVTKIEIIDVTNNGFGPDDILVTYPSMNAYVVHAPPNALEIMRDWSIETEYRIDSDNLSAEIFDPREPQEVFTGDPAQRAIIGDILRALDRSYRDIPIRFRFERNHEGFTFQMWDYKESALLYSARPEPIPDSVAVNDLLYVIRTDSTVIADTAYYDIFYVIKTVEDIHYIPGSPAIDGQRTAKRETSGAVRHRYD